MVSQAPADMSSARTYRVLWPMLLTLVVLTGSCLVLLYVQHAGRAITGMQARWSMTRNATSMAFLRHAALPSAEAHDQAQARAAQLQGFSLALRELNRPDGNLEQARAGLVRSGALPDDADQLVRVYGWILRMASFQPIRDRWQQTEACAQAMLAVGAEIDAAMLQGITPSAEQTRRWLTRIDALSQHMDRNEHQTQVDLAHSGRLTYRLITGTQLTLGLLLGGLCIWTTRRAVRHIEARQRALQRANERTALALQCAGMGLFELNPASGHYWMDAHVAGLHGLAGPVSIHREDIRERLHPEDMDATREGVDTIVRQGRIGRLDYRAVWPDGQVRHIESHGQLIAETGQVLGVSRDVTTERLRTQALADGETARRVALAQRSFLSRLSHELRTPLNAILGFAQLLAREENRHHTERDRQQIGLIRDAGQQLLRLVEDVLDLSKVEAGEIGMTLQPTDVRALLDSCLPIVANVAERHRVALRPPAPGEPLLALVDGRRLQQVFLNLMSNGCKYNRPGGTLTLTLCATDTQVSVGFADTGEGLSEAEVASLFKPFQRIERHARHVEGSGLGLCIVKQMVEGMGGQVQVWSTPGQGSCFTVTLPRSLPA